MIQSKFCLPGTTRAARAVASTLVIAAFCATSNAWATLGGDYQSVQTDGTRMHSSVTARSENSYTIHDLVLPTGTVVREYVSGSNKVFGVAWTGPIRPDLSQLLGDYFQTFTTASQEGLHNHRNFMLHRSDLIIESAGRMRAFNGRAVVTGLLPAGVTSDDVK